MLLAVAEDNVQKNISQMSKSLKQAETDLKNAELDKTAEPNDKFVAVMTISLKNKLSYILYSRNSALLVMCTLDHMCSDVDCSFRTSPLTIMKSLS